MDTLLTFLNQGWVGAIIGVIGVGFGIYQILHRTGPKLSFQYTGQRLIDGGEALLPKNVVVEYDGKSVARLSLSQIIVWNDGEAAVRGQDIVDNDPLRFCFGNNAEILSVEIEKMTRKANGFAVNVHLDQSGCVVCTFGFLDRNDGALIRVLHTGQMTKPICFGTIVGLPNGIQFLGKVPVQPHRRLAQVQKREGFERALVESLLTTLKYRKFIFFVAGALGIAALLLAAFPNLALLLGVKMPDSERMPLALFGGMYGPLSLMILWMERRRFPSSLMPDEIAEDRDEPAKV
jgi:hypothetical protein